MSLLEAGELGRRVTEQYGLSAPGNCELFVQGLNDTYVLSAGNERYALRVYRSGWRSDDDIAFELELLEHLKRVGARVCAPLRTRSGELSVNLNAPEGRRQTALFEFAEGTQGMGAQYGSDEARAYGEGVGLIHAGMDSFSSEHRRFLLDLDHLLTAPLLELKPRLADRPDDWSYLQRLANDLRDSILDRDGDLSHGICHGDFNGGNARRAADGSYRFFDFDCGGPGWRAYDIAVFRWSLQRLPKDDPVEDLWQTFIDGYATKHELKEADLAAVPWFVAIRQIWLMGLHAGLGKNRGVGFLNQAYFDREMKVLQDWQAEKLPR